MGFCLFCKSLISQLVRISAAFQFSLLFADFPAEFSMFPNTRSWQAGQIP